MPPSGTFAAPPTAATRSPPPTTYTVRGDRTAVNVDVPVAVNGAAPLIVINVDQNVSVGSINTFVNYGPADNITNTHLGD